MDRKWPGNLENLAVVQLVPATVFRPSLQLRIADGWMHSPHVRILASSMRTTCRSQTPMNRFDGVANGADSAAADTRDIVAFCHVGFSRILRRASSAVARARGRLRALWVLPAGVSDLRALGT